MPNCSAGDRRRSISQTLTTVVTIANEVSASTTA